MIKTKYPLEVGSVVRKSKTFSIMSYLIRANAYDNELPYTVYGKFSRFAISILDITNGTKSVRGNIKPSEIADISYRSEYALNKHIEAEINSVNTSSTSTLSTAYSVKITSGTLKGKTPATVLLEGNDSYLENQREWLQQNLSRYPNNKVQIDAINEAFKLKREGKLDKSASNNSGGTIVTLYDGGMHPLTRKTREDGKCFVYEIKITWQVGEKYPVMVAIANYYATVLKTQDGRLNVTNVDNSSRTLLSMTMSEGEWIEIISNIKRNMSMFEILQARSLFNDAEVISKEQYNFDAQ